MLVQYRRANAPFDAESYFASAGPVDEDEATDPGEVDTVPHDDLYISHVRINKRIRVLALDLMFERDRVKVTKTFAYGVVDPYVAKNDFDNLYGLEFSTPPFENDHHKEQRYEMLKTQISERSEAASLGTESSDNMIQILQTCTDGEVIRTFNTNIIAIADFNFDKFKLQISTQSYSVHARDLLDHILKQLREHQ